MNRKKRNWVLFTFVTVIALSLIFLMRQTTLAEQVTQELRQAERDMFAGKEMLTRPFSPLNPLKSD